MKNRDRRQAHSLGYIAEWLCIGMLLLKGYSILAHRYKQPQGEIDIIARRGRVVCCVEVKARATTQAALESITPEKKFRTMQAAQRFMAQHAKFLQHDLRFDVMVVTSGFKIHHLHNAWSMT